METNLTVLKNEGQDQLADTLRALSEAIGNADVLGDRRKEALEQVEAISAEAKKPAEQRRMGVVKGMAFALKSTVSTVADLTTVWDLTWPTIKAYFGLQ
jgi:hypothetical protein